MTGNGKASFIKLLSSLGAVLAVFVLVFALSACGGNASEGNGNAASTDTSAETTGDGPTEADVAGDMQGGSANTAEYGSGLRFKTEDVELIQDTRNGDVVVIRGTISNEGSEWVAACAPLFDVTVAYENDYGEKVNEPVQFYLQTAYNNYTAGDGEYIYSIDAGESKEFWGVFAQDRSHPYELTGVSDAVVTDFRPNTLAQIPFSGTPESALPPSEVKGTLNYGSVMADGKYDVTSELTNNSDLYIKYAQGMYLVEFEVDGEKVAVYKDLSYENSAPGSTRNLDASDDSNYSLHYTLLKDGQYGESHDFDGQVDDVTYLLAYGSLSETAD